MLVVYPLPPEARYTGTAWEWTVYFLVQAFGDASVENKLNIVPRLLFFNIAAGTTAAQIIQT